MTYQPGNPQGPYQGSSANSASQYVQPQFNQPSDNWAAPGAAGGPRPWEQGPSGVPMAPMQAAPPPFDKRRAAVLPIDGQNYASAFRPLTKRWGRFLIALGVLIGLFFLSQAPATIAVLFMMTGISPDSFSPEQMMAEMMGSEWTLVVTNIGWGLMIAGSMATMAVYGKGAWRYVLSVAGKWRWGLALKALGLFAVPFALYIGTTLSMEGLDWKFDPNWLLIFTVLLTTPLQATGEEFMFRGVLTQKIGGWIPNSMVAALVSGGVTGFIFGAIHGHGFSLATLQLMCVGWACSLLTHRTGGLEAASALHTLNNVFIMLPLGFIGVSALDPTAGGSGTANPFAVVIGFFCALGALGACYLLTHFFLKEQRTTVGVPGSEALLAPAAPVAYVAYPTAGAGYDAPYGGAPAQGGAPDGAYTTRQPFVQPQPSAPPPGYGSAPAPEHQPNRGQWRPPTA